ncbi:MAG: endonuclease/exonuclease/phosphatase family protein [Candidatus Limnocylindrales bacterium]
MTARAGSALIELRVATLNLRNLADRWDERLPLLLADFAALQPDLIGLQEVVYPLQQDRLLGASGSAAYASRRGWAGRPEYGNAVLVREGSPLELAPATPDDRLDLGLGRCAMRVELLVRGRPALRFVTLHLHHTTDDEGARQRDEQARRLLAWLADLPPMPATIVVGDFNADPHEAAYARITAGGYRSACLEANGHEPAVTWPSGLQAPAMDTDGDPMCLDYIWLQGAVRATAARLVFDRPAVDDPTLYPSDHVGVSADVRLDA